MSQDVANQLASVTEFTVEYLYFEGSGNDKPER